MDKRVVSKLEPYKNLLGKMPDVAIANMAGVSNVTVFQYRRKHGIPVFRKHMAGMYDIQALLNSMLVGSEPVVAEPVNPEPTVSTQVRSSRTSYQHLLGKVSDTLIAEVYGVDQGNVSRVRRRLKIPAMDPAEATWVTRGFKNFLTSHKCTTQ